MPKIDGGHKNCLTRENLEETHLRETFYGTLIFQQSSMICIGMPSNMAAKTTFCLYLVKRSDVLKTFPHHLLNNFLEV